MAVSEEERLLQLVLQLQDLMREGALSDKKFLCSGREVECLCQSDEVFQLPYFHIEIVCLVTAKVLISV